MTTFERNYLASVLILDLTVRLSHSPCHKGRYCHSEAFTGHKATNAEPKNVCIVHDYLAKGGLNLSARAENAPLAHQNRMACCMSLRSGGHIKSIIMSKTS